MTDVLVLGGTAEAVDLARALTRRRPDLAVVTSLAGLSSAPFAGPGAVRRGGFGGADGLAAWLAEQGVAALVDATHPFASTMAGRAATAARRTGVPRVKLVRPMWPRRDADRWIPVADAREAAAALARLAPEAALLTLGRRGLKAFASLVGMRLVVRAIEPPAGALPLAGAELILARGPFSQADETALMRDRGIGALVTKASGGKATEGKIDAARALGLPAVMIRRPAVPDGPTVATVAETMDWLDDRL